MPISEYVREMRELIGTRSLLLPSVAVFVWDPSGRLLMVANAQTGQWQTVGGAIEPGEDPAEAAVREAAEETGLAVALTRLRGAVGGPDFRLTYPNGDECAFMSVLYDATAVGGELLVDGDGDEVSAAAWFSPAELVGVDMADFTRVLLSRAGVLSARPVDALEELPHPLEHE